jgi:hypothetical protein
VVNAIDVYIITKLLSVVAAVVNLFYRQTSFVRVARGRIYRFVDNIRYVAGAAGLRL